MYKKKGETIRLMFMKRFLYKLSPCLQLMWLQTTFTIHRSVWSAIADPNTPDLTSIFILGLYKTNACRGILLYSF